MILAMQTLGRYFTRQFVISLGMVLGLLVVVMYTVEIVELLRRTADRPDVSFALILQMSAMKVPSVIQKLWPFVFLFGAMLALTRLANSSELVVVRAAGVSVWQILAPMIAGAVLLGAMLITVFNPVAAAMLGQYSKLENRHLKGESALVSVSTRTGLWLREVNAQGHQVIHALSVGGNGAELHDVTIFTYGKGDAFARRIDADLARLGRGEWQLENARLTAPDGVRRRFETTTVPTTLTLSQIIDSLAAPESLSFWELPRFIELLQHSGFSAAAHRLHWNALLAQPLLLASMVLLAAIFTMRLNRRRGGTGWVFFAGAMAGFGVFFVSDLVEAFGSAGKLPVVLAAWTPASVTTMCAAAMMFHLEDG